MREMLMWTCSQGAANSIHLFGEHSMNSRIRDGGKINFFDFLSIRPVLSIIDKKCHLLIKNRFCLELQKS